MGEVFSHIPVMLGEALDGLEIKPDGVYLDGTMGGAGHSAAIAARLSTGRLICLDKDPDAVAVGKERLTGFDCVTIIQSDFCELGGLLAGTKLDGALFDLGVSSFQLDSAERGFSYHTEAPLDMRMSRSGVSAFDVVNGYPVDKLTQIFREYGESPFAYEIAKKIVRSRENAPIQTTTQLAALCLAAVPARVMRKAKHPAKTIFQAVRIEVNDELGAIKTGLAAVFELLKSGGRICVISFHSVEDRVVKQTFRELVGGCICPSSFPVCVCGRTEQAKIVSKKPIGPSETELIENPRSHSAKLRIIEKL